MSNVRGSAKDEGIEREPDRGSEGGRVAVACGVMLVAFAVVSGTAISGKCAGYDEPLHAVAADVIQRYGDYRLNPEDPPLWQRFAALSLPRNALRYDFGDPEWGRIFREQAYRFSWGVGALYRTAGNDADAVIMRLRLTLLLLGAALGAVIGLWAWKLSGGVGAVAATAVFVLDPNVLAHSAIVGNDVAITLVTVSLAYAAWLAGVRLTWGRALAVVGLAAAAPLTKFSGPVLFIVLAILLTVRVAAAGAWECFGRALVRRRAKAVVALGLFAGACVVAYAALWAVYSFRFAPAPDGSTWDFEPIVRENAVNQIAATHPGRGVTAEEFAAWRPGPIERSILSLNERRLLPQTALYGLLFTYRGSHLRASYLCGRLSDIGFTWYFPLAFVFKMPLATQLALGLTVGLLATLAWRYWRAGSAIDWWTAACLTIPTAVMGSVVLQARLNIGIRHLFPVYIFIYVWIGSAAGYAWRQLGRGARWIILGLAAALAIETASAYPDFIPFFNAACGGARGGLNLLGDSNLDWGQNLPLLARWQRAHPNRNLYLCYFGAANPSYYGIQYKLLPAMDPTVTTLPKEPGVIAISATYLQGLYLKPPEQRLYAPLRNQSPLEVLGGSIYLFEYDPR